MIDRYSLPEMSIIWVDKSKFILMWQVECAYLKAMEIHGYAPPGTHERVINTVVLDLDEIVEIEKTTHHDVVAFINHVNSQIGDDSQYVHRGLTSSDIVDTTLAIQMRLACGILIKNLHDLLNILAKKSIEHAETWTIGRSHGIHAEPTSFGHVLAGHMTELCRATTGLKLADRNIGYGTFSGPVGTYSQIDMAVEATALIALGLRVEEVPTQVIPRDRHAQVLMSMTLVAKAIERMATNFRHLQRTEVGEISEAFHSGQKGSSAMPQKKNPITSENLCGLSRLVCGYSSMVMDNVVLWHERDISHSSVERVTIPDAMTVMNYMLVRAAGLVDGLVVNVDKMASNLSAAMPTVASSHVVSKLMGTGMQRTAAYDLVQSVIMDSGDFRSNEEIGKRLSPDAIAECMDPATYTRNVRAVIDRAIDFKYMSGFTNNKVGVEPG